MKDLYILKGWLCIVEVVIKQSPKRTKLWTGPHDHSVALRNQEKHAACSVLFVNRTFEFVHIYSWHAKFSGIWRNSGCRQRETSRVTTQ